MTMVPISSMVHACLELDEYDDKSPRMHTYIYIHLYLYIFLEQESKWQSLPYQSGELPEYKPRIDYPMTI